jgi:hypothetical protein
MGTQGHLWRDSHVSEARHGAPGGGGAIGLDVVGEAAANFVEGVVNRVGETLERDDRA